MKSLMIAVAVAGGALVAFGETLTFTNVVDSNGQFTWASKENWLKADGTNKAPAEGDDLVINKEINNFHAANCSSYVNSIHFCPGARANGISWNGLYLKSGGDGLIFEPGQNWTAYSTFFLDGDVKVTMQNNLNFSNTGAFKGRDATRKSRILKYGPGTLSGTGADVNWTGATIYEGQFTIKTINDKSGVDFYFDGSATSAKLNMSGDLELLDGGLQSSETIPATGYEVTGNYTLTVSGAPKADNEYFAGAFVNTASFTFNPTDAAKTFTFAKATSTTVGNLTVANGTVRIADGASLS